MILEKDSSMEVNQELLEKAIRQAIANVSLEFDICVKDEEEEKVREKIFILEGNKNGGMGRLYYRWY